MITPLKHWTQTWFTASDDYPFGTMNTNLIYCFWWLPLWNIGHKLVLLLLMITPLKHWTQTWFTASDDYPFETLNTNLFYSFWWLPLWNIEHKLDLLLLITPLEHWTQTCIWIIRWDFSFEALIGNIVLWTAFCESVSLHQTPINLWMTLENVIISYSTAITNRISK